jgi:hypothetical protein
VGCLNTPTGGTGDLGNSPCPAVVPFPGDFTFYIAAGVDLPAQAVTAGDIVECRKNSIARSCNTLVPLRPHNDASSPPIGCLSFLGSSDCPSGGYTGSQSFTFELWGPFGTGTDATAKVEACVTLPGTTNTASCSNVSPAGAYTIPSSSDALSAATFTSPALLGCVRPGNTACPPGTYPLISNTIQITACRSTRSAAAVGACDASYTPICDISTTSLINGVCAASETLGCVAPQVTGGQFSVCAQLTSNNKYPTAFALPVQVSKYSGAVEA